MRLEAKLQDLFCIARQAAVQNIREEQDALLTKRQIIINCAKGAFGLKDGDELPAKILDQLAEISGQVEVLDGLRNIIQSELYDMVKRSGEILQEHIRGNA